MSDTARATLPDALARSVEESLTRRRRRDLGVWRGEPVWIENAGPDGANILVRRRAGRVEPVAPASPRVGSSLYAYEAPGWAALSRDQLVVVCPNDARAVTVDAHGTWGSAWSLGEGLAAGYPRRVDASHFAVVVDEGPSGGRRLDVHGVDGTARVLRRTAHLVSDLVVDASGRHWAWLEWPVGTMPWDRAQLWTGAFDGTTLEARADLATGVVAQPSWVGDQLWISRESGQWSQPWRRDETGWHEVASPPGEFRPDWCFGRSWRAVTLSGVLCGYVHRSRAHTGLVSSDDTLVAVAGSPAYLYEMCAFDGGAIALASSTETTGDLWNFSSRTARWRRLDAPAPDERVSGTPRARTTAAGTPYVWCAPERVDGGERPGLVAFVHGGPTAYSSFEFSWLKELYCRAGFAVASVDYRGSTSYGRDYRQQLDGHWGDYDVADVRDVVHELVARGEVDPRRVFARGSSAGALTALLVSRDPVVRGVVAVSAVCDLRTLATHARDLEIESEYVAQLVGAPPEHAARYDARSPLAQAESLVARVLLIHGVDDDVVPVAQARQLAARLRALGREVELLELPGERHGLRHTTSLRRALTAELAFLTR